MIRQWLQQWQQARESRLLARRAIPDALWALTLAQHPYLAARPPSEQERLRALTSLFLSRKEFTGAGGLTVTDEMAVTIAAQACLPVLHLGLSWYEGFVGIVVHPGEVVARREVTDEAGVVHHYNEVLSGEAMYGGPVTLSWQDVASAGESAEAGYNVVIHEFVHKIDMLDGEADGIPPLPDRARREAWWGVIEPAYEQFCDEVDAGMDTFLDPYGATSIDEFFAVAAEAFFVAPKEFAAEHPALHRIFRDFFRQDPASH